MASFNSSWYVSAVLLLGIEIILVPSGVHSVGQHELEKRNGMTSLLAQAPLRYLPDGQLSDWEILTQELQYEQIQDWGFLGKGKDREFLQKYLGDELPGGQYTFGEVPRGELPGGQQPEQPGGQQPEQPDGQQPEQPGGQQPEQPDGQQPEQPGGQQPEQPDGQQPEQPDGQHLAQLLPIVNHKMQRIIILVNNLQPKLQVLKSSLDRLAMYDSSIKSMMDELIYFCRRIRSHLIPLFDSSVDVLMHEQTILHSLSAVEYNYSCICNDYTKIVALLDKLCRYLHIFPNH